MYFNIYPLEYKIESDICQRGGNDDEKAQWASHVMSKFANWNNAIDAHLCLDLPQFVLK